MTINSLHNELDP